MKNRNLISVLTIIGVLILSGCGPSAKELSERSIADSIAKADSLAKTQAEEMAQAAKTEEQSDTTVSKKLRLSSKTPLGKKFIRTGSVKFKVKNVHKAVEKIEEWAVLFGGYTINSEVNNTITSTYRYRIDKDSCMDINRIEPHGTIQVKIPNEKVDSFVRNINQLIVFMDYRMLKLDEMTFTLKALDNTVTQLSEYEKRQTKNIDNQSSGLRNKTAAEEELLQKKTQKDNALLNKMVLDDQVKYCTISFDLYQANVILKNKVADFDYEAYQPGFWYRFKEVLYEGWVILKEFILFVSRLWSVVLIGIGIWLAIRFFLSLSYFSKNKNKETKQ